MMFEAKSTVRKRIIDSFGAIALLVLCFVTVNSSSAMSEVIVAPPVTVVRVTNAEELLRAIGSNVTIELAPGQYDLAALVSSAERGAPVLVSPHIQWTNEWGGASLLIHGVSNMRIVGPADGRGPAESSAHLVMANEMLDVLWLDHTSNVTIENVVAGHGIDVGVCSGAVFHISNSSQVIIRQSKLYGSGSMGLYLANVIGLTLESSEISDCTWSAMDIQGSRGIRVANSFLTYSGEYSMFNIDDQSQVSFESVWISDESTQSEPLFGAQGDAQVILSNSRVYSQVSRCLCSMPGVVAPIISEQMIMDGVRMCREPR